MENFEIDSVQESTEGIDPSALERAQEKARENAKQAKKDKAKEQRQKASDDKLYDVVLQIIDHLGYNHTLSTHMVQALSQNVPSNIVLASIAIIFDAIQEFLGINLIKDETKQDFDTNSSILPSIQNQNLNMKAKLNLNEWLSNIDSMVFEDPKRMFNKIVDPFTKDTLKKPIIDLIAYSNQEYFQRENVEFNPQNVINFVNMYAENMVERLVKFKENQYELQAAENDPQKVNFESDENQ